MRSTDTKHILHFIFLLVVLSIISLLILAFQHERNLQIVLTIVLATVYVLWGMIHHFKSNDLHPRIVLEYLLIAVFGASILISLLLSL